MKTLTRSTSSGHGIRLGIAFRVPNSALRVVGRSKIAAQVQVVPQLRCQNGGQAHFDAQPLQPAAGFRQLLPRLCDRIGVEVARFADRLPVTAP